MRRSSTLYVTILVSAGLIVGRLIPPLAVRFEGHAPVPGWSASLLLLLLAAMVGGCAWSMWQSVHRDKRTVRSSYGVRMLALAKAAIMVGGVFCGGYLGFALAYLGADSPLGQDRFWQALAAGGAAALLLVVALVLEWACLVPRDEDEDGAAPTPA